MRNLPRVDPYFLAGLAAAVVAGGVYFGPTGRSADAERLVVAIEDSVVQRLTRQGIAQILGDESAPATIVEFVDYQCPACGLAHAATWPWLDSITAQGRVRYIVADFPVGRYVNALPAAVVAHCVAGHGGRAFWRLRDQLL